MDLVGRYVTHARFGRGTVIRQSDGYVTVAFGETNRVFVYPDAFGRYLEISDRALRRELEAAISLAAQSREERLQRDRARSHLSERGTVIEGHHRQDAEQDSWEE